MIDTSGAGPEVHTGAAKSAEECRSSEILRGARAGGPRPASLPISEVAFLFGVSEEAVLELASRRRAPARQQFFSIPELADRWRCSRGTVYNRLRAAGAEVLDFAARGMKGRKAVPVGTVLQVEARHMRRLR